MSEGPIDGGFGSEYWSDEDTANHEPPKTANTENTPVYDDRTASAVEKCMELSVARRSCELPSNIRVDGAMPFPGRLMRQVSGVRYE